VATSGPVIDPAEIDRLLRPFERMGPGRTGQQAGLGLAIVQATAEAHGATVTVRAAAGGGLEVEVGFPVPAGAEQASGLLTTAGT
jgi:signal transduction histidine kinase